MGEAMPGGEKKLSYQRKEGEKFTRGRTPKINESRAQKLYEDRLSDSEIALELDVDKSTIRKWRQKNKLPPINKRGQRGAGKKMRVDRQEAVNKVVNALIREPFATVHELTDIIYPKLQTEERNAAVERVRCALRDLERDPLLAGETVQEIKDILIGRVMAKKETQRLGQIFKCAKAVQAQERVHMREERLRRGPARYLLGRVLYYNEVCSAIQQMCKRSSTDRDTLYSLARSPGQIGVDMPIHHVCPGATGTVMSAQEAKWRAELEINIQKRAASLLTMPLEAALNIIAAAKALRKARKRVLAEIIKDLKSGGDGKGSVLDDCRLEESRALLKLNQVVLTGLNMVGWADPSGQADQVLETQAAREARIADILTEAEAWASEPRDVSGKWEDWPDQLINDRHKSRVAVLRHQVGNQLLTSFNPPTKRGRKVGYNVTVKRHASPGGGYYQVLVQYAGVFKGNPQVITEVIAVQPPKVDAILPDIIEHWGQVSTPGSEPYIKVIQEECEV